jgi:hypothetical protein
MFQLCTACIVVPCCMKPTNNTHLCSWNMMAITVSRLHNLQCHRPTMLSRNLRPLIYCCWNEMAQAVVSTLWSSDYGSNTHSANNLWNSQMILTTVPRDRLKSVAVQSVILLFLRTVFSALICSVSECAHHYATLGQIITSFP